MTTQKPADIIAVDEYNLPYSATLLASADRTTAPTDIEFAVPHRTTGIEVVINVTAVPGSAIANTVSIQGVTKLGAVFNIITSASITGTGVTTISVAPSLPATANVSANALVPELVIVHFTVGNSNHATYSAEVICTP